jgi:hypothetical protein
LAISLTCDLDSRVMSSCSTSFSIRRVDPEQIGGGHHADQGRHGPTTPLKQPLREIAASRRLGGQVDAARAGVPPPMPIAVAGHRRVVRLQ